MSTALRKESVEMRQANVHKFMRISYGTIHNKLVPVIKAHHHHCVQKHFLCECDCEFFLSYYFIHVPGIIFFIWYTLLYPSLYAIVPVMDTDDTSVTHDENTGLPAQAFGNHAAKIICKALSPLFKSTWGTNCGPAM